MTGLNKLSLRTRIFIAMIFIVVSASVLIALVTIKQYNEQAEEYHNNRLKRKEEAIKSALIYELNRDTIVKFQETLLPVILEKKLNEISDIHNLDINIYDLDGYLLRSSFAENVTDTTDISLSDYIMKSIVNNPSHRLVLHNKNIEGTKVSSSFSYLTGSKNQPLGIISVPYLQDNSFQDKELREFLGRLGMVYMLILFIAIVLAYFLSKYITKSLENVSRRIRQTTIDGTNEKIVLDNASEEIINLVDAYNGMIDQIEDSAIKLAQSQRKQAWREMARQVAHEIKNPLTPMRLTVQSFGQNFSPEDPEIHHKLEEFCDSLLKQIDIMSSIASAFSSFAEMPRPTKEVLNVVDEVKKALDIFHEPFIHYLPEKKEIMTKMDKIQLTRIVTNLVTNAIHALGNRPDPRIDVVVTENEHEVLINVVDNGIGIEKSDYLKIFEPKFTTKSRGMGLGLPMVKNIVEAYQGTLTFSSVLNEKTEFSVSLPKEE
jgi:two-component system nitrogen regulation sensor histidine kinase NtrY